MKLDKAKKYNIAILILCLAFLGLYSFLVWSTWLPGWAEFKHLIFNWPDANANYFFAKIFSIKNILVDPEPYSHMADNLVHSRSINVLYGNLVPMTFLPAIAIYGWAMKILGSVGILWLTPLLASITAYVVYRLSFYIFKDLDLAFLTAVLFLPLAPWLYFANIVMVPSVLFIFLLLTGFLFIAKSFVKNNWLWWILASVFLSAAVTVRPTEIIWVSLVTLVIFYWQRKKISWLKLTACLAIFVGAVYYFLYLNNLTYADPFTFGYLNLQTGTLPTEFNQSTNSLSVWLKTIFIPFGFDLYQIAYNFYKHVISLVWYYVVFALAGLSLMLIRIKKGKANSVWYKYFWLSAIVFVVILLFYGSWDIADPLVKELNKISISYVRYFMPLYILMLPLIAYSIKILFYGKARSNQAAYWVIIAGLMLSSVKLVFYAPYDGLFKTRQTILNYYQQFAAVKAIAPSDSIIISERSDKVFFPYYKVVVPQGDLPLWKRVEFIINDAEIYYFTDQQLDQEILKIEAAGLDLAEPIIIDSKFKLYKIKELIK